MRACAGLRASACALGGPTHASRTGLGYTNVDLSWSCEWTISAEQIGDWISDGVELIVFICLVIFAYIEKKRRWAAGMKCVVAVVARPGAAAWSCSSRRAAGRPQPCLEESCWNLRVSSLRLLCVPYFGAAGGSRPESSALSMRAGCGRGDRGMGHAVGSLIGGTP